MESSIAQLVVLLFIAGIGLGLLVYLFSNRRTVFQEDTPMRAPGLDAGSPATNQPAQTPVDNTPPQSSVLSNPPPLPADSTVEAVRSGQRLIILGVGFNIFSILASVADESSLIPWLGILFGLVAIVIALIGLIRMSSGLGLSTVYTVFTCFFLFVPLISLLILVSINSRATAKLREHGYKVGFAGASKQ